MKRFIEILKRPTTIVVAVAERIDRIVAHRQRQNVLAGALRPPRIFRA